MQTILSTSKSLARPAGIFEKRAIERLLAPLDLLAENSTHFISKSFGQFQANDIPLEPGANTVTAVVTTQDGQTTSHAILVNSTGRGALVTHAAPTEGLSSLVVRFTVENPDDVAFNRITFDLDDDGTANVTATPAQFVDGILNVSATYPTGTWIAVITAYDDRDQVIYSTRKSIVVLSPAALQAKLMSVYDGMPDYL